MFWLYIFNSFRWSVAFLRMAKSRHFRLLKHRLNAFILFFLNKCNIAWPLLALISTMYDKAIIKTIILLLLFLHSKREISRHFILSLRVDHQENLWVGTYKWGRQITDICGWALLRDYPGLIREQSCHEFRTPLSLIVSPLKEILARNGNAV